LCLVFTYLPVFAQWGATPIGIPLFILRNVENSSSCIRLHHCQRKKGIQISKINTVIK